MARRLDPPTPCCLYKHQQLHHQASIKRAQVHNTHQNHLTQSFEQEKRNRASNGSHAQADRGGRAQEGGVRDLPRRLRRLLEGRGGPGQGPPRRQVGLPARGGRAPRRPRGPPPEAARPGLRRPRDRARVPAGEPDPVRHGILRHQLFQAPHLGVRGVREDGVPGRRHPGVRQHRPPVRPRDGQLLRRQGLLLREDVEPHPAVRDRLLPAVPRQGCLAGARPWRAPAAALLQRRHVRARAQHGHRQGPPRQACRHRSHPVCRAGLPQHVLQGRVQAHPAGVQPRARHALEAPREHPAPQGQGRPLLRRGFEAVEVHRRGGQHGEGGHQDAGQEMVGHLRRREPQLQACRGRRGRRPAACCPRRGRRRQVLPGALRCLGSLLLGVPWSLINRNLSTIRDFLSTYVISSSI